jgi:hypothetical protein
VASTVSTLMEAYPTAGPAELSAWTARVLGLHTDSTPDNLMLVNGIVIGIVLYERLATGRQLNMAQIAMQTDPFSLISGGLEIHDHSGRLAHMRGSGKLRTCWHLICQVPLMMRVIILDELLFFYQLFNGRLCFAHVVLISR